MNFALFAAKQLLFLGFLEERERELEREWESGIDNGFDLIMRNGSAF